MPQVSQEDEQSVARICRIQTKAQAVDTSEQAGAMGIWREDVRCGPQKASTIQRSASSPIRGVTKHWKPARTNLATRSFLLPFTVIKVRQTGMKGEPTNPLSPEGGDPPSTKLPIGDLPAFSQY